MVNKLKEQRKEMRKKDKAWRFLVLQRDNGECIYCGSKERINAHHIIPRCNKEFRWIVANGCSLCAKHHRFSFEFSAHQNPMFFYDWFSRNRHGQYHYLLNAFHNWEVKKRNANDVTSK